MKRYTCDGMLIITNQAYIKNKLLGKKKEQLLYVTTIVLWQNKWLQQRFKMLPFR